MIVRPDGDSWLLIRQPDHAALAADILTHWRADGVPDRPTRERLLIATREHDAGWTLEDDAPVVDPETGAPWDFIHLPVARRQAVWPRAVEALGDDAYVAALVAHHAVTAYARYDGDTDWRDFFRALSHERDSRVATFGAQRAPTRGAPAEQRTSMTSAHVDDGDAFASFLRDYASLRAADLISLALCHGWQDRFELDHYRGHMDGNDMTLTPDPFDGTTVEWHVPARRIARRRYASDAELRRAVDDATVETLRGHLHGRPEPLPS